MKPVFPGVYESRGQLFTQSRLEGFKVHGEAVIHRGGMAYRHFNPNHSKLAAAIANGLKTFPFTPGSKTLYLGAAQGVTVSFLSDIVGSQGEIYAVEISKRAMRDLIFVCEKRDNILPILADASKPDEYAGDVGQVDVVFEDVAAKNQAEILLANADACLKPGGFALIAIKSQSIDSAADPEKIFHQTITKIARHLQHAQTISLEPFEKDHVLAVFQKS
ncbi:fibrillarin-like rRNA/tRNA 2'-O-methyltransferase [Candidatus Micrarchaeota archaeon]|nr:fibrillarin-like rRNA/tRNA 2'-O-methyltransferase [Candidatus Micrarchaeota archaeon]